MQGYGLRAGGFNMEVSKLSNDEIRRLIEEIRGRHKRRKEKSDPYDAGYGDLIEPKAVGEAGRSGE